MVEGRAVPLEVRVNPRARRVALKVDGAAGRVILVLPHRRDEKAARRFLGDRTAWLAEALNRLPPPVALADGAEVPIGGVPHPIRHCPDARRGVWLEDDGTLCVSGQAEHLPRRVQDWLKARARTVLTERVAAHAARLGVTPGRITLRDTRSRWGSCAPSGALNFSWRLVMAPEWVLDYVAAHEVAHLRELNHSPAFWAHVETLVPGAREPARAWLREHGTALQRVG
ncbi:M48 family metallopeptidase [Roseospira marina]|uniref:M48 family metallopeptidase n=2 Tax=Roseospira marina TaxID=140057 RepID=A0A5M6I5S3_9PROT|nr:M48 family metallopeptidase [Roseospira marina]